MGLGHSEERSQEKQWNGRSNNDASINASDGIADDIL
jgi:hypothetical protein